MLNTSLIIIFIVSLIIIGGFIYLAKIIFSLRKKLSELTIKPPDENKEKIVNNVVNHDNDTLITDDIKKQNLNKHTETNNTNNIQEYNRQIIKKRDSQEYIDIDRMANSYLSKSIENDGGEAHDYHEANIMKVNKTDGVQTESFNPNKVPLKSSKQLYKLDIVVEKTPIDKALKNDYVERKR